MTPGEAVADWQAEALPPDDLAEMVIGITIAQFICEDSTVYFAERATAITISLLLRAPAPDEVLPPSYEDEWDEVIANRVVRDLARLVRVGVLNQDNQGDFIVPAALRGAVARGIASALAVLSGAFEVE